MSPQTWNRYSYCYNNPLALVDDNGKWPTGTHRKIVDGALKGLADHIREGVKLGSRRTDHSREGLHTAVESNAPQHAMTPGSWVRRDGIDKAKQDAKTAAGAFINENLAIAKSEFEKSKGAPDEAQRLEASLVAFGKAMHTIMDNVSPSHGGFQVYDNQSSFISGAMKGAAGGVPGMIGSGLGTVVGENVNHAIEESREPTEDEYNQMSDRIRIAFLSVYGQEAYKNVDEKERQNTAERIRNGGFSSNGF